MNLTRNGNVTCMTFGRETGYTCLVTCSLFCSPVSGNVVVSTTGGSDVTKRGAGGQNEND